MDIPLSAARWRPVCTRADFVTDFAIHGDDIYLVTATDTPRARVVRTSLVAPEFSRADVVAPAGEAVVHSVAAAADVWSFVLWPCGDPEFQPLPATTRLSPERATTP